jgi:hypothetical protein
VILVGEESEAGAAEEVATGARSDDRASAWAALCRSWGVSETLEELPAKTAARILAAYARLSLPSLGAAAAVVSTAVPSQRAVQDNGTAPLVVLPGSALGTILDPEALVSSLGSVSRP